MGEGACTVTAYRQKLDIAVAEARRFIERAEALPVPYSYQNGDYPLFFCEIFPREKGAIRRASMDLTRALADLRNPAR